MVPLYASEYLFAHVLQLVDVSHSIQLLIEHIGVHLELSTLKPLMH